MPTPNPSALDFFLTRRSRPAKTLTAPAPDHAALETLLTAAARTPDHGKLEPWRFVVLEGAALQRVSGQVADRAATIGLDIDQVEKARLQFANSPLCVAVIESPKESPKVPQIEQTYSTGAVCLALVNAALAAGWGANWLSGWASHDSELMQQALTIQPHERVAGFIHIGTETSAPPERPRPDLSVITTWISE